MFLRSIMAGLMVGLLLACGEGETESATEGVTSVAREAIDRYIENTEGVEGYTITFEVDGRETTQTYIKKVIDGIPVYIPEGSQDAPRPAMVGMARLLERARHEGAGQIEGESTDVLVADDAADLAETLEASDGFRPTRVEIHVGRDNRLIRQVTTVGELSMPTGEARGVIITARFDDWRTVDGFAYPFKTTSQTAALDAMSGRASEEIQAMDEVERSLEEIPESQREPAREAMKSRIEATRRPAAGGDFDMVVVVKDLQVNRGSGR
jgi:hypothetical protein